MSNESHESGRMKYFNKFNSTKKNQTGATSLLLLILFTVIVIFVISLLSRLVFDYSSTSKELSNYSEDLKKHNILESIKQDYKYDLLNDMTVEDTSSKYTNTEDEKLYPFKIAHINYGYEVDKSYLKFNNNYIDYNSFSNILKCYVTNFDVPTEEEYKPSTYKDLTLPKTLYGNYEYIPFYKYDVSKSLSEDEDIDSTITDEDLLLELYGKDVRTYSIGENFYVGNADDFEWDLLGYNPNKVKSKDAEGKDVIKTETPSLSKLQSLKLNANGKLYFKINFAENVKNLVITVGNEHEEKSYVIRKNECNPFYAINDIPKGSTFIKVKSTDELKNTSFELITARELTYSVFEKNRYGGLKEKVILQKTIRMELTRANYRVYYKDSITK